MVRKIWTTALPAMLVGKAALQSAYRLTARALCGKASVVALSAATLALSAPADASLIRFDFNDDLAVFGGGPPPSPTAPSFAGALRTGGTSGSVTLSVSPVGAGVTIDDRDRGTAATPQGVDNNDDQVPMGTYGDMYRDALYALNADTPSEGMNLAFTGLAANRKFDVTLWAYDSVQRTLPPKTAAWGPSGGSKVNISFRGDASNGPGPDPNTNALTDYSISFPAISDGAGALTIEGRWVGGTPVAVIINGIQLEAAYAAAVPEPTTVALFALGLAGVGFARRRKPPA